MRAPDTLDAIERRLVAFATQSDDGEAIVTALCRDLLAAGLPLWRVSLAVPTIDPLFRGASLTWRRGSGLQLHTTEHGDTGAEEFARSPIGWLGERGLATARWRLDGSETPSDLPLLARLAAEGGTDYLLHLTAFAPETAIRGVGLSFATDRPGGFDEAERAALAGLVPAIALATSKLTLAHTLREALGTYLGPATGTQVLAGAIRRGEGRVIPAAILLADLRGFTTLADREDALRVVGWLDEHFDALAEPVARHGGEVSKFLGDGFLAVFPVSDPQAPPCLACAGALEAAREALARNDALNARRRLTGAPELAADIVLHYGTVVSGNVGTGRRLDFTVIGRAVNEASRMERLCEEVGEPLLISDAFAQRCEMPFQDRGEHTLRGVGRRLRIWTLPDPS